MAVNPKKYPLRIAIMVVGVSAKAMVKIVVVKTMTQSNQTKFSTLARLEIMSALNPLEKLNGITAIHTNNKKANIFF